MLSWTAEEIKHPIKNCFKLQADNRRLINCIQYWLLIHYKSLRNKTNNYLHFMLISDNPKSDDLGKRFHNRNNQNHVKSTV